jgi:hypothetical protein
VLLLQLALMLPAAGAAQQNDPRVQLHGNAFSAFVDQNTLRGGSELQTTAWLMTSYTHPFNAGEWGARVMLTLDPLTLGDCGYARLALGQLGQCDDRPFDDRVAAHPLLMDVSLHGALRLQQATLSLRAGLVGEPALGPVSYMHRPSAQFDPALPLTSFDLNPAHIASGFATMGIARGRLTLELSAFNNDHGDDDPYDLDTGAFDSFAARAGVRLGAASMLRVSAGQLDSVQGGAHAAHGGIAGDTRVVTVSLEGDNRVRGIPVTTTFAWGRQHAGGIGTNAFLAEALVQRGPHAVTLRAESHESIDQDATVVILPDGSHSHSFTNHVVATHEIGAAWSMRVIRLMSVQGRVGVRGGVTFFPERRHGYYGEARGRYLAAFLNLQRAATDPHVH